MEDALKKNGKKEDDLKKWKKFGSPPLAPCRGLF
jgi:hypothetical protein